MEHQDVYGRRMSVLRRWKESALPLSPLQIVGAASQKLVRAVSELPHVLVDP